MNDRRVDDDLEFGAPPRDQNGFADQAPPPVGIAEMIGTRNLLIIIFTMPLVFIFVVAGIIMTFGSPLKSKSSEAVVVSTQSAAVSSAPVSSTVGTDFTTTSAPRAPRADVVRTKINTSAIAPAAFAGSGIALPDGASTGAMALDGSRLAVRIDGDGAPYIAIYNLGTNQVEARVPLNSAPAVPPATDNAAITPMEAEELSAEPVEEVPDNAGDETSNAAPVAPTAPVQNANRQNGLKLGVPGETAEFVPSTAQSPVSSRVSPAARTVVTDGTIVTDSDVSSENEPRLAMSAPPRAPNLAPRRTRYVVTP